MKRIALVLSLSLLACPSKKEPPAEVVAAPVQVVEAPPEPEVPEPTIGPTATLGPLQLVLPMGFIVVSEQPNSVLIRHISDLTVSLGFAGKTKGSRDEKTIDAFLAKAETELKKINEAKVRRETRTLPNSSHVIRGVVAHTVDANGTPVNERREMWVLSDGPAIITASFIYLEDAPAAAAAADQMLEVLRESADALSEAFDK